jgi:hypothetical protein
MDTLALGGEFFETKIVAINSSCRPAGREYQEPAAIQVPHCLVPRRIMDGHWIAVVPV